MMIGLLLNSGSKLCNYSIKYKDILDHNNIPYLLLDINSPKFINEMKSITHLLFRHTQGDTDVKIYDSVLYIAENILGIKCYPNSSTCWPFENKTKEYYLLKSNNFPVINSRIFFNYGDAYDYLCSDAEFPIVMKLPKGAGSTNVVKINNIKEGKKVIDHTFGGGIKTQSIPSGSNLYYKTSYYKKILRKYYPVFMRNRNIGKNPYEEWQIQKDVIINQEYLPNNKYDTRITVIGNKVFAFRRYVRNNDFRASGSGNIDVDPAEIDIDTIKIAITVSKKLNFQSMAYDFLYNQEGKPLISEISYAYDDKAIYSCPGYWDTDLKWHDGKIWPQLIQLIDFIGIDNLVYKST